MAGGGGSEVSADFQEPLLPGLLAWQRCFLASVDFSIWRPHLSSTDIMKTLPRCQVSFQALWVYFDMISAAQKRDGCQGGKVTCPWPSKFTLTSDFQSPWSSQRGQGLLWLLHSDEKQGKYLYSPSEAWGSRDGSFSPQPWPESMQTLRLPRHFCVSRVCNTGPQRACFPNHFRKQKAKNKENISHLVILCRAQCVCAFLYVCARTCAHACVCVHMCVYTCVSANRGSVFFLVKTKARLLVMRGGNWKAFCRISLSLRTRKKMLFC